MTTPPPSHPALADAARQDAPDVLRSLDTTPAGLTQTEADRRLAVHGPNEVGPPARDGPARRFLRALRNPLVILLAVLATLSFATGDPRAGSVISLMVLLGVALRFLQEARADHATARLRAMITVTATVLRDGQPVERPLRELVPGDVVQLAAGDMVPADVRLLAAKDLFAAQSTLTGESPSPPRNPTSPTPARTSPPSNSAPSASSAPASPPGPPPPSSSPPAPTPSSAPSPKPSPNSNPRPPSTAASTASPGS